MTSSDHDCLLFLVHQLFRNCKGVAPIKPRLNNCDLQIREGRPRAGPNDGFCNQLTVFEKRIQREKGGRVVTEDSLAKRQIEQTLEESEKFSNFGLARRIILEKQEKVNFGV